MNAVRIWCLVLMATIVLPGCFHFTTFSAVRNGRTFAPRPADCEVAWLNMDPLQAALQYEHIGMIFFEGVQGIGIPTTRVDSTQNQTSGNVIVDSADVEAAPKLKERARVEACRFGADAMMINGHAMSPMSGWANSAVGQTSSVLLFHKRETPLALGATGLPGTPAVPTK